MSSVLSQSQTSWPAKNFVVYLPGDSDSTIAGVRLVLGPRSAVDSALSHLDPQPGPSNVCVRFERIHFHLDQWSVHITGPPQRVSETYRLVSLPIFAANQIISLFPKDPLIIWSKFSQPPKLGVLVNSHYAFGDIYQLNRNSEPPLAEMGRKSAGLRPPTRIGYLQENKALTERNALPVAFSAKQNVAVKRQYRMTRKEIGSLIGKKGRDIERIREQTTAKIKIHDTADTENVGMVPGINQMQLLEIIGLKEEVKEAEQLIQKKISQWRATKS
ncbi:hypothetical protein KL921_003401 [Ogataea angusta]|nr:hypothetical protein KL921_003401 [Ogataea angusta]KAG7827628.1 hypothetical protein KL920_004391 [Ogataea angusta]